MEKLTTPKLAIKKKDTVKRFQDICNGLTVVAVYAIIWLFIAALGYRIFLWVF